MLDQDLLKILACPETKQPLSIAGSALIEKANALIETGQLNNRAGEKVTEKIQTGLVSETDPQWLYPVRDDIPVLLIDEALSVQHIQSAA